MRCLSLSDSSSPCLTVSRPIHASADGTVLSRSPLCMNSIFLTRSPVDGHLRCSHALAVVNRAALNVGAHVSFFKMHLTLASSWTYHASCKCRELQFLFYFKNIYLFGCARPQLRYSGPLVAAFGILLPNQGSNSGPLHLERGVLAARPPGKSWATCMFLS